MEFRILGALEVSSAEGPLTLGGRKQRLVLAHLIARANAVVPPDVLIDGVWGEEPPDSARSILHTYVSRLRRALGERLQGRHTGYVLHVHEGELDATSFEAKVKEAKTSLTSDPAKAAAGFADALALWRGPAFGDLADEASLQGEIARLDELRLTATEHRISAELQLGRHSTMVSELEALTSRYPLRERLWAHLMLAMFRSGRPAEALSTYERAREVLASELGADLLHLRKVVLPARAVLTDLSTRKSPFVSEATQPYLGNMVGTIERVLQDVLVDRDILSGALNNYMSLAAHKTSRTMSRLTVVSIIFLPWTFLCGVYGMNFDVLPELHWEHGYLYFWSTAGLVVLGLLWLMKRNKLL